MLKDEGNRREEDTQEIIRKRETSWDVSHQDTVEIEMVSSNRSVWELDKVGIGENWEEEMAAHPFFNQQWKEGEELSPLMKVFIPWFSLKSIMQFIPIKLFSQLVCKL